MGNVPRFKDYYDTATTRWKPFKTGDADVIVTPPTHVQPLYGINVDPGSGERGITNRISWFGRVPVARLFYSGNLPAWNSFPETSAAPEKRAHVSFKPTYTFAQIAAGAYDSIITNYCNAVPSDWKIWLTMWHEPNGEISAGTINFADYKAAWLRISQLMAGLASANYVVPSPLFSAPKPYGSPAWNDSWMFTFAEMNNPKAVWAWDSYGGTKGNAAGTYPPVADALDMGYALLDSHGWTFEDGHWAITEFNCGRRDVDTDGTVQAQWVNDYVANCVGRPAKPSHILIFDGSGTLDFDTQKSRDNWKSVTAGSL